MGKFLDDVKLTGSSINPQFINPTINMDTFIDRYGRTSGNNVVDIILNKSIEVSNNLNELRRQNELTDIELKANQNIQDYELSWNTKDINGNIKDKYSDENYGDYLNGLQKVYEKNKLLITDTKYTNASDVNKWEKTIQSSLNNTFYTEEGKKSEYDINKITDETILNINSIDGQIISNGDPSGKLTEQKLALFNGLEKLGIPKHKIEAMKMKSLIDTDISTMKLQIQETINNPTLSIQEKRERLNDIKNGFNNNSVYVDNADEAVKKGFIDKKYAEFYKDYSSKTIKEAMISADGYINKFENDIRNEEYQNHIALQNQIREREKKINSEKYSISQAIRTGDNFKAISIIEDRPINGFELVQNQDLTKKYYGKTPEDILWKENKNSTHLYIPTLSIYETNSIKNQSAVDKLNGIPRSTTASYLYEKINSLEGNERENLKREYLSKGIITSFEYGVLNGEVKFETDTKPNMINYSSVGKEHSSENGIQDFAGLNSAENLSRNLRKLSYNQKQLTSQIIIGAIKSKPEFVGLFPNGKITLGAVNKKYNSNNGFREFVNDVIQGVHSIDTSKYTSAQLKQQDYIKIIEKKYDENPIIIRHKTQESGIEYNTSTRSINNQDWLNY